jgi:hypothetical protein
MVHALEKAYRLLRPRGLLVNLHAQPTPARLEVHAGGGVSEAGALEDRSDFETERLAWQAVDDVLGRGLFRVERELTYDFEVHARTLREFRDWLAETWETAFLPKKIVKQARVLIRGRGAGAKLVLRVPARMMRLRAR